MDEPAADMMMDAMMGDEMMMEGMMEDKLAMPAVPEMPDWNKETEGTFVSVDHEENLEPCCCCLCTCSTKATQDLTCCCCFPIKCGMVLIGGFTVIMTFYYISWYFLICLNDQTVWWYPLVQIVLLIPMYLGSSFWVVWFAKDSLSGRGKLPTACILVIVSICCCAFWAVCYYVWCHKKDEVFIGFGVPESNYIKYNKKYYVFKLLLEAAIMGALYSYFLCITVTYKNALRFLQPPKEEMMMEGEEKKDEEAKME